MQKTVNKCTNYTLSETGDMIGRMSQLIKDYCHMEGTGPYERIKSQVSRMSLRIQEEEERREAEAETAFFKAHPELNP